MFAFIQKGKRTQMRPICTAAHVRVDRTKRSTEINAEHHNKHQLITLYALWKLHVLSIGIFIRQTFGSFFYENLIIPRIDGTTRIAFKWNRPTAFTKRSRLLRICDKTIPSNDIWLCVLVMVDFVAQRSKHRINSYKWYAVCTFLAQSHIWMAFAL